MLCSVLPAFVSNKAPSSLGSSHSRSTCVLIFPEKCMHTSLFAPGGLEKVNMHGIILFLAFHDDDFMSQFQQVFLREIWKCTFPMYMFLALNSTSLNKLI